METGKQLGGIAITTITPLTSSLEVDETGIHRLVEYFLQSGLNKHNSFIVPLSTTGNFSAYNLAEKKQIARVFFEAAKDDLNVVIGCNTNNIAELTDMVAFAAEEGAAGVMYSPPFYWKADEDQIVEFYLSAAAKHPDVPVIIYNNHWASQNDLSISLFNRLAGTSSIIGIKESTYSIQKLVELCRKFRGRYRIFNGLGEAYEPLYTWLGCAGFTSTFGVGFPRITVRLQKLLEEKKYEEADRLSSAIAPCAAFLDSLAGGQYIAALKYILKREASVGKTVENLSSL